jgi:hypothetical protein
LTERGTVIRAIATAVAQRLDEKTLRIVHLEVEDGGLLTILRELGYTKLYGTSSSRAVYDSPHSTSIRYLYSRTSQTHFPPCFFDCCVALRLESTKELGSVSEGLREGGIAVLAERRNLDPTKVGFKRVGGVTDQIALFQKVDATKAIEGSSMLDAGISILSYSLEQGGIGEYTRLLEERLSTACGKKAEVVSEPGEASAGTVIVEYANGLVRGRRLVEDVAFLTGRGKNVLVEIHDTLERFDPGDRQRLQGLCTLAYRANEAAERDRVTDYFLLPHLSFANVDPLPFKKVPETVLGSFGFAARYKRTGLLIRMARRLGVPLNLMISINKEVGIAKSTDVLKQLEPELGSPVEGEGEYSRDGVTLRVGFFGVSEIAREMSSCSHIIFAHTSSNFQHSGVMTLAKRFTRPIVAIDSFQAKQAQVVRVKSFTKMSALGDSVRSFGASFLDGRLELGKLLYDARGIIFRKSITRDFLLEHTADLSRDEDGFEYLKAILERPVGGPRP